MDIIKAEYGGLEMRILVMASFLFIALTAFSAEVSGIWAGTLHAGGQQLRLVFHISWHADHIFSATMDSLDEGAMGITVAETTVKDDSVVLVLPDLMARFTGTISADGTSIIGTWSQGGGIFPLTLKRLETAPTLNRPMEPQPPYPYQVETVMVSNTNDNIMLAGTLTIPISKKPVPAVVLITGSGAQDRDESIAGHRPFLVIADALTRRGIAVLRMDDRGVGKSTGDFASATSADFVNDALAGVAFLKKRRDIKSSKIGLIGHSEGGLIAPAAAVASRDVAFIVLLAGPGLPGTNIILRQLDLISRASGKNDAEIERSLQAETRIFDILADATKNEETQRMEIAEVLRQAIAELPVAERAQIGSVDDYVNMQINAVMSPWFRYFLSYDPRPTLRKVTVPVLALNGEKDLQVAAIDNLVAISQALIQGGNLQVMALPLANLNHLFQNAKTGAPSEYATIEETFDPATLTIIGDWILAQNRQ